MIRGIEIPADMRATAEHLAQRALRRVHGVDAAVVVEGGPIYTGSIKVVASELERQGYQRQAGLVRAHDPMVGPIAVLAFVDGTAITTVLLNPSKGDA